jgi:hypothetical protein
MPKTLFANENDPNVANMPFERNREKLTVRIKSL